MNKKLYVTPETEELELKYEGVLCASIGEDEPYKGGQDEPLPWG